MALKLKVKEPETIRLQAVGADAASLRASAGIPIYPNDYTGSYTITPGAEAQTIPTDGLMMTSDLVVEAIPSNYGLITWDGSTLTVS